MGRAAAKRPAPSRANASQRMIDFMISATLKRLRNAFLILKPVLQHLKSHDFLNENNKLASKNRLMRVIPVSHGYGIAIDSKYSCQTSLFSVMNITLKSKTTPHDKTESLISKA